MVLAKHVLDMSRQTLWQGGGGRLARPRRYVVRLAGDVSVYVHVVKP